MGEVQAVESAARLPAPEGQADLRLGRWQDVLADVECDAWISDAPYGEETHAGHDAILHDGNSAAEGRRSIDYDPLRRDDVAEIVAHWHRRTRGWMVSLTDHNLVPAWETAMRAAGRQVFCPIPVIDHGSRVRLAGDGPSNWTVWMVVSRPRNREFARWGTLPGVYERSPGDPRSERMGGKPLGVMRAIVRDYSRPGDVVCDPFAGYGTTLLAALMEGRRAIGAECDPEAHAAARARLGRGYTLDLFGGELR